MNSLKKAYEQMLPTTRLVILVPFEWDWFYFISQPKERLD